MIAGSVEVIGWSLQAEKHLGVGRLPQEKLCDSKYHTKKKPFNQMKSETNIGIKS